MPLTDKQWSAAGGAAFPCDGGVDSNLYPDPGMTLRDYFAAKALPVLITITSAGQHGSPCKDGETYHQAFAREAYELADAMLRARGDE